MEEAAKLTATGLQNEEYRQWVERLSRRYKQSQIKAAARVNSAMLEFYWMLGRDIEEKYAAARWGAKLLQSLSRDLKRFLPDAHCFSPTNLLYMKNFYRLYSGRMGITPQLEELDENHEGECGQITPQAGEQTMRDIMSTPWGHHKLLIDKCAGDMQKAVFFVHQIVEHGWSRAMLLNYLDTDMYERHGKAITNFSHTLPEVQSDLAQELTKDPYCFDFTEMRDSYNERLLKDALIANIEKFLVELGTGFAYMGREYRIVIGKTEQFLDMLFYNVTIHCYVVVEVKTVEFSPAHIGQLGTYVVAVDHILRKEQDNKTIGLLICKTKDSVLAQYALEASDQPLGISEYELSKIYPAKVEGTIPSVKDIERELNGDGTAS